MPHGAVRSVRGLLSPGRRCHAKATGSDGRVTRATPYQPGPCRVHRELWALERFVGLGLAPDQPHLARLVPAGHTLGMQLPIARVGISVERLSGIDAEDCRI